ncbi:uncharacterized protein LOC135199733 [Macrobrachium nipponense]|uniref:uncharacterized protein LOC135199733 n=1 Tax=Macrobrachium nipponense TaxID=159736 RepID=UPI0030C7A21F
MSQMQRHSHEYRRAIGTLLYVANGTRPDLSFDVSYLSHFLANPKRKQTAAVKYLIKYLNHSHDYCIVFRKSRKEALIFSDADFANNKVDRKSSSGLVVCIAGGPVEWRCKKQTVVATPSQQAEYIAMAIAMQEALWLCDILREINASDLYMVLCILTDSTAAINLAEKDIVNDNSKAVDVKYHCMKDVVKKGLVKLQYVASHDNLAYLLTKGLTGRKTQELCARIGLIIP